MVNTPALGNSPPLLRFAGALSRPDAPDLGSCMCSGGFGIGATYGGQRHQFSAHGSQNVVKVDSVSVDKDCTVGRRTALPQI